MHTSNDTVGPSASRFSIQRLRVATMGVAFAAYCASCAGTAFAANQNVGDTTVAAVAVNGGTDTANPGTTCVRIAAPVSASCAASYVAIPNNNRNLIAAALLAKTSGAKVWFYYEDATATQHCPGRVFTPCTVISIETK